MRITIEPENEAEAVIEKVSYEGVYEFALVGKFQVGGVANFDIQYTHLIDLARKSRLRGQLHELIEHLRHGD